MIMRVIMTAMLTIAFSLGTMDLFFMESHAGTIKGMVKFAGDQVPSPLMLKIDKDQEVCGKDVPSDALSISKNFGVLNAVVSIDNIKTVKKAQIPKDKLAFVQEKCMFHPRMLLIPVETEFQIYNKDPLTHNIHTFGKENATINRGQPKTVPVIKHSFEVPERIKVKCDIHKWMSAWFIVVDNPYTVVTNAQGNFSIKDIPPGTYTVQVWHEALGPQTQEITIKGDEEVQADFKLEEKKKRRSKK
jgi:plastocyanin